MTSPDAPELAISTRPWLSTGIDPVQVGYDDLDLQMPGCLVFIQIVYIVLMMIIINLIDGRIE